MFFLLIFFCIFLILLIVHKNIYIILIMIMKLHWLNKWLNWSNNKVTDSHYKKIWYFWQMISIRKTTISVKKVYFRWNFWRKMYRWKKRCWKQFSRENIYWNFSTEFPTEMSVKNFPMKMFAKFPMEFFVEKFLMEFLIDFRWHFRRCLWRSL